MTKDNKLLEMEETYRKFLRLYERFTADRLTVSKQGEALGKIMSSIFSAMRLKTKNVAQNYPALHKR